MTNKTTSTAYLLKSNQRGYVRTPAFPPTTTEPTFTDKPDFAYRFITDESLGQCVKDFMFQNGETIQAERAISAADDDPPHSFDCPRTQLTSAECLCLAQNASRYTEELPPENTRADFLRAMKDLAFFLCRSQRECVMELARGEERQFFFDKMVQLANIVAGMPATYEQDGQGDNAIAYLHYFKGGCDWYVTEKDKGSDDDAIKGIQAQAFGFANLGDPQNAELGYISIQELIDNQVELDFHFMPRTIREIKIGIGILDADEPMGLDGAPAAEPESFTILAYHSRAEAEEGEARLRQSAQQADDGVIRSYALIRTSDIHDDLVVSEPPAPVGAGADVRS